MDFSLSLKQIEAVGTEKQNETASKEGVIHDFATCFHKYKNRKI